MALTPEQVERKLVRLELDLKELAKIRGSGNPFEDLTTQLALENGATISARARKMPMSFSRSSNPTAVDGSLMELLDGATHEVKATAPVPSDWVLGTDITLHLLVFKSGTGAELAVLRSWISSQSDGETWAWNIESDVDINATIPASNELHEITRTITASGISVGEQISWMFRREGADGSDVLSESLLMRHGPWLEYTAFF